MLKQGIAAPYTLIDRGALKMKAQKSYLVLGLSTVSHVVVEGGL